MRATNFSVIIVVCYPLYIKLIIIIIIIIIINIIINIIIIIIIRVRQESLYLCCFSKV